MMGARESLQKLADKKYSEISDLKLQLAQAEAYWPNQICGLERFCRRLEMF